MRWLVVALALVAASTADAKTLIVRCETDPAISLNIKVATEQYQTFTKMLEARGATFASTHISNTKTEWLRTGRQVWGTFNQATAPTEQFDCIVVFHYQQSVLMPTGANPESLTFGVKWPQVPVVFIGDATSSAGKWTATSGCSTGVKSLGTAYSSVRRSYVVYPVGSTHPWKDLGVSLHPVVNLGHAVAGTVFRPIVAMNYSATVPGGVPSSNRLLRADADSTGYTAAGNDSVLLWARINTTTNVPIIFCEASANPVDVGLIGMAMQMADSASGGNVWDKPNARPIQAALAITAVTSRGKYTNAMDTSPASTRITHLQGGTFCYADSCDSSNVLAGLDSLGTLGGLKTTFFVEPCSLATYPNVKNWLYRAGQYRVGIQGAAGFGTATTQIMGAASSTYPIDPLGATRTRFAAQSTGACGNASDTALVTCNLLRGRAIIKGTFGELFDPSIFPAAGDWSPVAYTRSPGAGPGIDSMAYAIWKGGIRAVVIRPEWINSSPGVSANTPTATGASFLTGASAPASDPYGYGPDARRIPVYSDPSSPGTIVGYLKIVAERGEHGMPNVAPGGYASHDTRTEWFSGLVSDAWYSAPIIGHTHNFFSRTQVFHVSLGRLGGHGDAISARSGWYDIKHTHNQFKAANDLGWVDPATGHRRAMFEWVYVSELQP